VGSMPVLHNLDDGYYEEELRLLPAPVLACARARGFVV